MPPCRDRRALAGAILAVIAVARAARADPPDAAPDAATDAAPEVIEVRGAAPVAPGAVSLDADVARQTAGALGGAFRALALLPGVVTPLAVAGYPIIRGTLPGESRYEFDGIELPQLYHFLVANEVIHPAFLGDVTLRAGGQGAETGHVIGGLVTISAAGIDTRRTELRANLAELGAFHARPLSPSTGLAAAVRVGTLAIAARLYDPRAALYSIDQQTRLVHRLGNGDQLSLTSLLSYDDARLPPDALRPDLVERDRLGFHRLAAQWLRARGDHRLHAGIETAIDSLRRTGVDSAVRSEGGASYGVRGFADARLDVARWLTARGGVQARVRALDNGASPFELTVSDPFLGLARRVDAEGAWTALDLRLGALQLTPGIRADRYHAALYGPSVRHVTVDPRLAIAGDLGRVRAELAIGAYSAPPQLTVHTPATVIGPLPMTDGAASLAGMNRAGEVQLSLAAALGAGWQGSFAVYHRETHYAADLGLAGTSLRGGTCGDHTVTVYRNVEARASGVEAMIRRDVARSVTGWLSYSLGEVDRDLGFVALPGDFDQRHTLSATAQWRLGAWRLGASGHVHTGRPLPVREIVNSCGFEIAPIANPARARRPPTSWRIDLRAERTVRIAGGELRLYAELQNASFTREIISYDVPYDPGRTDDPSSRATPNTLLIPLPLVGIEAVL